MTESPHAAPRRVAHPVLDGHRRVDALWFPHDWRDEAARRRAIVDAWRPGCEAHRFADGDLLRFAAGVELDCDATPGWPLQRVAGTLCSAAIEPGDLAGRAAADAWLALGAALRPLRVADAATLDPSLWLSVEAPFVDTFDLRLREAERPLVAPPARGLRELLGPDVPAQQSAEATRFLEALRRQGDAAGAPPTLAAQAARALPPRKPLFAGSARLVRRVALAALGVAALYFVLAPPTASSSGGDGPGNGGAGLLPVLGALAVAVLFARMLTSGRPDDADARSQPAGRHAAAYGPRTGKGKGRSARSGPGVAARAAAALRARFAPRLPQRWRDLLARAALTTGLGKLLGAQHAAYLRRMLALFDDGNIEDALRHAVPLGDDGGGSLGQAFGRLGPRQDLSLRRERGATTSMHFGNDFEAHLRTLYRRTFEKLDALGRIDEAVFVLAELLRARQEALDYLEKHGRFAQAAELAFGWDMPAVQIVRLHALAGNWRLALEVARRDDVFAQGIALLEKRWPDAAARLRREWAQLLVAQGRWLDAVQAIWPLADERSRADEWLQVVEQGGGAPAARSLALRALCLPDSLASRGAQLAALRDDPSLAAERAALATELLRAKAPIDPAARRLAGFVAGMAIADQAGPQPTLDAKTLQALAAFAGDPLLSADLPEARRAWPGAEARPLAQATALVEWPAPPAGLHAIVDAVPLADGEFLVALGEAGALRLDARGRRLAHFEVPAHQLVVATDGRSALALARRERVWRVSRLDLARGAASDLGLHAFDAFADAFDGIGWSVGIGDRVQVLDTRTPLRDVLWQVADLPGQVVAIDRTGATELIVLRADGALPPTLHQWNYALPGRRLRARDALPPPAADEDGLGAARILVRGVGMVDLRAHPERADRLRVAPSVPPGKAWADIPAPGPAPALLAAQGWLASRTAFSASDRNAVDAAADGTIHLVSFATGRPHACWRWPAIAGVGVRHVEGTWLVFDGEGRLAAVDVATGRQRALSVR